MSNEDENRKTGFESSAPVQKIWDKLEDGTLDGKFCIPLGENDKGEDIAISLDLAFHILIAGGLVPGVDMFRRVALATLLKFNKPDDLQLILIDPTSVYFCDYKNIDRYLVFPIINEYENECEKAAETLEWACQEMSRRHNVLAESKTNDIKTYNRNNPDKKIPTLVITTTMLIDDIVSGYDRIRDLILKLLTLSKDVDIHLILSNDNEPCKEMDIIKKYIPTIIAFRTSNREESSKILGHAGAEKLLGANDMIVSSKHFDKELYLQGYYLDEFAISQITFDN